jgi:hypothetical protein
MQFIPPPSEGDSAAQSSFIMFYKYTEEDPAVWLPEFVTVVEEYASYVRNEDLTGPNKTVKAQFIGLVRGIGVKYNILDLMEAILEARFSLLPPQDQLDQTTDDEVRIINEYSAQNVPTQFMSKLRLIALDCLKQSDKAQYALKTALWLQNYERVKFIFEKRVKKILDPSVFISVSEVLTGDNYNVVVKDIAHKSVEQLTHMYRDLYYVSVSSNNGCQKLPFLKRWLEDEDKQIYVTCRFDPTRTLPNNYNTFFGLRGAAIPNPSNLLQATNQMNLILRHIKEVYCNDDEEHAQYFYKWMANIVKYPWKKTQVLILLFGVEGCGKGMIIDFFAHKVLGKHVTFQTASPGVDLFAKHAVGFYRKLFVFCDEAGDDLNKNHEQLKNSITAETIRFEGKNKDTTTEPNFVNIIVASNNPGSVRVSPYDRRVVAFQCSEKYKGNHAYFNDLAAATGNDECARAMYDYLLNYDLPQQYNFQESRPITAYYESLQLASLPLFWRFMSYKCNSHAADRNICKHQASVLFDEFKEWKTRGGYDATITEKYFSREMSELARDQFSGVIKAKRNVTCYDIRFDTLRNYMIRNKKYDDSVF